MATPIVTGLTVAATALGGRYMIQAFNTFKNRAAGPQIRRFYPGGFERQNDSAALILGIRERAALEKMAHRIEGLCSQIIPMPEEAIISLLK